MSNVAITWAYAQHTKWGAGCKAVLVALADMADEQFSCYPGQELLGALTDQDVRSVRRQVDRLIELGLVSVEARFLQNGHRTSDRYVLAVEVDVPRRQVPGHRDHRSRRPPDTVTGGQESTEPPDTVSSTTGHGVRVTQREPSVEPSGTNAREQSAARKTPKAPKPDNAAPPVDINKLFERFWSTYPRHDGRAPALVAFKKALTKADIEVIVTAAGRYRDDPNREAGYTAHGSTWLNQERWTDPPLPPRGERPAGSAGNSIYDPSQGRTIW